MSACAQDPLEFEIPLRLPTAWLDIDAYESTSDVLRGIFGCVVVRVVTPLGLLGSSGTPTIDCTVHASFVNPRLSGFLNENRVYGAVTVNQAANVVAEARTRRGEGLAKDKAGLLSGLAEATAVIARNIAIPGAGVVSGVARFLGAGLRSVGLNKPTSEAAPKEMIAVTGSDICNVDGLESTMPLTLRRENQISNDWKLLGLAEGEDDLRHLATRLNLVTVSSFDGTAESGTNVFNWLVTPMWTHAETVGTTPNARRRFYMSHHSYLGTNFMWWRGSMKYRLRFVCSQFTTARVRLTWLPSSSVVPDFTQNIGDVISLVLDICGDTEVEFSVPYLQAEWWKVALAPVAQLDGFTVVGHEAQCNGNVWVSIVNPVKTSDSTADSTISVILMQGIGEDMQFSGTAQNHTHSFLASRITPESRTVCIPSSSLYDVKPFPPFAGGKHAVDVGVCMGDNLETVRELMHRFSHQGNYTTLDSYYSGQPVPHPLQNDIGLESAPLLAKLCAMFLFARGKVRFKLVSQATSTVISNRITHNGNSGVLIGDVSDYVFSAGSVLASGSTNKVSAVEISHYAPWAWFLPQASTSGTSDTGARFFSYQQLQISGSPAGATVEVFVAAGDDFQVGVLCAPPHMYGPLTPLAGMGESGQYPV